MERWKACWKQTKCRMTVKILWLWGSAGKRDEQTLQTCVAFSCRLDRLQSRNKQRSPPERNLTQVLVTVEDDTIYLVWNESPLSLVNTPLAYTGVWFCQLWVSAAIMDDSARLVFIWPVKSLCSIFGSFEPRWATQPRWQSKASNWAVFHAYLGLEFVM